MDKLEAKILETEKYENLCQQYLKEESKEEQKDNL